MKIIKLGVKVTETTTGIVGICDTVLIRDDGAQVYQFRPLGAKPDGKEHDHTECSPTRLDGPVVEVPDVGSEDL
jgi:hypothetical protein